MGQALWVRIQAWATSRLHLGAGHLAWGTPEARRRRPITRDSLAAKATRQLGLVGAKPPAFNAWVLDLLGYQDGDELVDLFPGTGGVDAAASQGRLI